MHPDGPTPAERDRARARLDAFAGRANVLSLRTAERLCDRAVAHTCTLDPAQMWRTPDLTCVLCTAIRDLHRINDGTGRYLVATLAWEPCLEADCSGCHFCWHGTPAGWARTRLSRLRSRLRRRRLRRYLAARGLPPLQT